LVEGVSSKRDQMIETNGGPAPVLQMRGIDKVFPGAHALKSVDLTVRAGEILALVGENGAGKSTLVKILSGAYERDAGSVTLAGEPVETATPNAMLERGVAVIYQEPALAPHLSVAENIFMGRLPTKGIGVVNWSKLRQDTAVVAQRLGLDINPRTPVRALSVARRQMVEIAKALSRDARVIVLDEPSAVLGDAELRGLFEVIRRLADRGVAFVYISHRLNEVFEIADRVMVMKDGRVVADAPTHELSHELLVRRMVGRDIGDIFPPRVTSPTGREALRVRGLRRNGLLHDVDLAVREGEILGVAGLAGAGRTEVLRAIHGADPIDGGEIEVFGEPVRIGSPRDAIALGIGLLTEDRKFDGLLLQQSVSTNVTVTRFGAVTNHGVLQLGKEKRLVEAHIRRLSIRTSGPGAHVRNLSGGNQQKVILAKWLHAECRILLIDEPTRGVDVGAKREIYQLLRDLASRGAAIVMVSSELPEILGMSDRIVVMREGRVSAELSRADATEERIMLHATRHDA
jgi:ribose transport system ATP-binding protein